MLIALLIAAAILAVFLFARGLRDASRLVDQVIAEELDQER